MNNLIPSNTLTMSSREIAQLTNKEHKNVKRDIEKMLSDLKKDALTFERIYTDTMNRKQSEYFLDKDHVECLLTGYSAELRMKVIKRWHELEEVVKSPDVHQILNDPKEMRGLLLTYSEKVIALEERVGELQPKAEALDRIAKVTDGSMCITDAAKHLDIAPKQLFTFLSCKEWIYRRLGNKNWVGYQDKIQKGLLEHKIVVIGSDDDGNDKTAPQVRITRKGLAKLSEMLTVDRAG